MRRGGKYLQSSTYNSYKTPNEQVNKTLLSEGWEREGEQKEWGEWEIRFFYLRETKTRVTDGNRVRKLINKFAWSLTQLSRHVQQRHFQLSTKASQAFLQGPQPDCALHCGITHISGHCANLHFFKLLHVSVQLLSPSPPFLISFNSTFHGKWV